MNHSRVPTTLAYLNTGKTLAFNTGKNDYVEVV